MAFGESQVIFLVEIFLMRAPSFEVTREPGTHINIADTRKLRKLSIGVQAEFGKLSRFGESVMVRLCIVAIYIALVNRNISSLFY